MRLGRGSAPRPRRGGVITSKEREREGGEGGEGGAEEEEEEEM